MKFILSIDIGNDAMRTQDDIGRALHKLGREFGLTVGRICYRLPEIGDNGRILDDNGNRVGGWHVEENK